MQKYENYTPLECLKTALFQVVAISLALLAIAILWSLLYLDYFLCAGAILFFAVLGKEIRLYLRTRHSAITYEKPTWIEH